MSLIERYQAYARRRRVVREARLLLREARRGLRKYAHRISKGQADLVRQAIDRLAKAVPGDDWDETRQALNALDKSLDDYLPFARKSTFREYAESIGVAVLIALFLRAFVVEAFKIPSGSMIPTLQVGDHIFVNKFIYGVRIPWTDIKFGEEFRPPKRGEVIVFKYPKNPEVDFIKRIVAAAGDTVEMRDNQVWVNGKPVPRVHQPGDCHYEDIADENTGRWEERDCEAWKETVPTGSYVTYYDRNGPERSFYAHDQSPWKVPPDSVFVMGDNRDNSHDSRFWGFVPYDLIKGKAMITWFSIGEENADDPAIVRWFKAVRVDRMFKLIH